MSTTYTTCVGLGMSAYNDPNWNTPVVANWQALDALSPVGDNNCVTNEFPSASLNVKVAAGQFQRQDGTVVSYAGGTIAIAASSTKVLYLDGTAAWALTSAASYPSTPHLRIATVVSGATTITSITDNRQAFIPSGSWFDGSVIVVGTSTGLQIASATSQKLGFFGTAPVVQPTIGAGTAGTSYTTNEQGMLQRVYNAVRALGLGS
jgi:hypothetical protein